MTNVKRAHNDAMGTTVVAACDGSKSLLASSIPLKNKKQTSEPNIQIRNDNAEPSIQWVTYDLQLDCLPILLNSADFLASQRE
jgi:hypothetical protein